MRVWARNDTVQVGRYRVGSVGGWARVGGSASHGLLLPRVEGQMMERDVGGGGAICSGRTL